jgi:3D (Asp-Asp-Asp) domain-containing protein
MRPRAALIVFIVALAAFHVHAQELTFDIPAPTTAAMEKKTLWATYYHIWPATEAPAGVALLDENNKRISGAISQHDWCRGAIEGTVLVTKADGSVQTFNYIDHQGAQQVDCSKVLGIDPIKKPWITATGKSRYRVARGTYGDGVADYKLIPYRTIAVDEATIPYGSVVYIPQARGMTIKLPSGTFAIHDGYFFAADKGGAIKGNHIDVFAGILTSNPFPNFVKSSAEQTFDAFIVRDVDIVDQLTALHQQKSPG